MAKRAKMPDTFQEFWPPPSWVDRKSPDFSTQEDGGFLYYRTGSRPHRRADGTETVLHEWIGRCAQCGRVYDFTRPVVTDASFNRRCTQHKRVGQKAVPYQFKALMRLWNEIDAADDARGAFGKDVLAGGQQ